MLQVRGLTVKLLRVLKQDLLTMVNEDWRDWKPLFNLIDSNAYPAIKGQCYLCHLQNSLISKDLRRTCLVTKKLSLFLKDFVIFEPKSHKQAMIDCQRHAEAGAAKFSVSEFGLF